MAKKKLLSKLAVHDFLRNFLDLIFITSIYYYKKGWRAVAKSAKLKVIPFEPDNQTNVEESITKIKDNDASLTSLNLNNIKNIFVGLY